MIWAIGEPGAAVRMFVEGNNQQRAELQARPGEIAVPVEKRLPFPVINAEGDAIFAGEPPPGWEVDRIRARRTALLAASDWTQALDAPLSEAQREAWRVYRQALRDITETQPGETVETIVWPDQPL